MMFAVEVFISFSISCVSECFSNLEFSPLGYSVPSVFIHLVSVCIRSAFATCCIGVTLKLFSKLSLWSLMCWYIR